MLEGFAYCRMIFENGIPTDFIYLDVNGSFERLTGLSDVIGRKVTEIIPGIRETSPELFKSYGRIALGGPPEKFEYYVQRLGIWFSLSVYNAGEHCFVAVFDNITERKLAVDALLAMQASLQTQVAERTAALEGLVAHHQRTAAELFRLSQVVAQSTSAIYITELDGVIAYVNAEFERVTGWSAAEAIGRNPRILKSPNTPPEVYAEMWRNILSGQTWSGEIEDLCKDGRRFWAQVRISPLRDEAGAITHYVATHDDITQRKDAELCMHQAAEQAEVANRAKSEILANMSHELRTPLNAIIGFSAMMNEVVFGPLGHAKYTEYADDIHGSAEHLLELINDILDVSAIEAGKLALHEESLDVVEVLTACLRLIAPRAEKGRIGVRMEAPPSLPRLYADARRLKQIVLNLLSNGVKFTEEGGSVTLAAEAVTAGGLRIVVTDTGIGMDEAGIAKAIQRFGQVDSQLGRKYEGTGLGLPLTKSLVELHDGDLHLASRKGEGTVATVHLPASRLAPQ
jgi:PAS domain S-box-containing protein